MKRVLVTLGPTRAYLDPVRYITNYSTGELGYLLCKELIGRGMKVAAVAGPTNQPLESLRLLSLTRVEMNDQMQRAVLAICRKFKPEVALFSAAVLDFVPHRTQRAKVASDRPWKLDLVPSAKIIDVVGRRFSKIRRIGFKLEWKRSRSADRYALSYLRRKGLEGVCLNFLYEIKRGRHWARFYSKGGKTVEFRSKEEIARGIAAYVEDLGSLA